MVQSLKGILSDRSEAEIYAALCDCGMDPDFAIDRLINQDTFHEVKRKRDKKKETKPSEETRPRSFPKSLNRGYKPSSDRGGRFPAGYGESSGVVKGPIRKEGNLHVPVNSSALDVQTSIPTETTHISSNISQADVKYTTSQPPPQVQHGWGIPGRPSMAEIVKMGRPQPKAVSRPVANSTANLSVGDSIISNTPSHTPKEYNNTVSSSEVGHGISDKLPNGSLDILPTTEGVGVVGSSVDTNIQASATPDPKVDGFKKEINSEDGSAESLTVSGQFSASGKDVESQQTETASHLDNGLIEKTDVFHSDSLPFDCNQNLDGDISTSAKQFDHLTLNEGPKSSEDNPAVIIPDHLQVSDADCAHLTFGSFISGTLDASLPIKPLSSQGEVLTIPDNHSMDQLDVRMHEDENKAAVAPTDNEYVASSATKNTMEDLDAALIQQSEVTKTNFMDATNNTEYNLPSASHYANSSAVQQDSATHTYLQENRQLQNISPLSSFMQMQNGLLPPGIPPLREFDPAFSLLLTNPPTIIHGTTSASMSNAAVSMQPQENVNPSGLPNPQLTQSQPSTSIASGAPLPQHLALHPYAQAATLPLGYASMIGYPSLPPSYAYIQPAFQQPYMNSGLFHQAAAAVPNSSVKYPLPQYKSNITLPSLPQPASMLSSYIGGFGTANNMPGNFPLNQSTATATTTPGFDGTIPSQYKDGNQFISLQQNENPGMWMHGAGSRAMPPLAANTLYGYQGQSHQAGVRQGQLPSQFGTALGQSQPGLGPEHRNPSDNNLSAVAQANPMWPTSY